MSCLAFLDVARMQGTLDIAASNVEHFAQEKVRIQEKSSGFLCCDITVHTGGDTLVEIGQILANLSST
jgi:hypothetical protein